LFPIELFTKDENVVKPCLSRHPLIYTTVSGVDNSPQIHFAPQVLLAQIQEGVSGHLREGGNITQEFKFFFRWRVSESMNFSFPLFRLWL
jgi:hypothetical protein